MIEKVRREVGSDAKIIRAQKVRRGGLFGFFARELFELTVEVPSGRSSLNRPQATKSTAPRSKSKPQQKSAQRKQSLSATKNGPRKLQSRPDPNVTSSDAKSFQKDNLPSTPSLGQITANRQSGMDSLIRQRYFTPSTSDDSDLASQDGIDGFTAQDQVDFSNERPDTDSYTSIEDTAVEAPDSNLNAQETPVLSESDYLAMRYWAYFLVPRSSDEVSVGVSPDGDTAIDPNADIDLDNPADISTTIESPDINPIIQTNPRANKGKAFKESGEHKVDLSYLMPVRTPGTSSTALERVSPPISFI